jgi:hypothetical protein
MGFEVLTAVVLKSTIFWDITLSALTLVSCSVYFSTLKMAAICSSETLVDSQRTARRYIPEDSTVLKYMLTSRHQSAGQTHGIRISNRSFENAAQFKYLGTTVRNQNFTYEEIKSRLNSGNARYCLIQNLLSSVCCLKNVKIRMYKN